MFRNVKKPLVKACTLRPNARTFSDAAATAAAPKRVICRPTSNLKVGICGLPNIGKSMMFNAISMQNVPSENYPFCTIDPNNATVAVPDPRVEWLKNHYNPPSCISAVLNITDIAGIVAGAHEGKGLGNAFLSHIGAVDALFHLVRVFPNNTTGMSPRHTRTRNLSVYPCSHIVLSFLYISAQASRLNTSKAPSILSAT